MSGLTQKSEFRNAREYHIGVVLKREDGKMKGMDLEPGQHVWMDEEEQMATANAPRMESDNPFVNGDLELVQGARALANRRPIGDSEHPQQETGGQLAPGAQPSAEPEPVGGDSADDEGGSPSGGSPAEAEAPSEPAGAEGNREPTQEEAEANARAAAARRRPPAANEPKVPPPPPPVPTHIGTGPKPEGDAPEGKRAPAEEVGTPEAVPSE